MNSNLSEQVDSVQDEGHVFQDSDCSSGSPSLNYSVLSSKAPTANEGDVEIGVEADNNYHGDDHDNDISTIGSHSVFKDTVDKRNKTDLEAAVPLKSVTTVDKETNKGAQEQKNSSTPQLARKADPPAPMYARPPASQSYAKINRYQPASLLPDDEVTVNSKSEEQNDQELLPTDPRLLKIASAAARMGASSPIRTSHLEKGEEEVPHDEPFVDDDNLLPSWGVGSSDPHRWDVLNTGLSPNKLVAADEVTVSSMGQHSVVSDFRRAEAEKAKPSQPEKNVKDEELASKNDPQNTTRSTLMESLDGQDRNREVENRSALPAHIGKLLVAVAMLLFSIVFVMIGVYFVNGGFEKSDDDNNTDASTAPDYVSDDQVWREWMERRNHTYPGGN